MLIINYLEILFGLMKHIEPERDGSIPKVEKPKTAKATAISENEMRITAQGRLRNYISYAISLLEVFIYLFIFGMLYPVCTFFCSCLYAVCISLIFN